MTKATETSKRKVTVGLILIGQKSGGVSHIGSSGHVLKQRKQAGRMSSQEAREA